MLPMRRGDSQENLFFLETKIFAQPIIKRAGIINGLKITHRRDFALAIIGAVCAKRDFTACVWADDTFKKAAIDLI